MKTMITLALIESRKIQAIRHHRDYFLRVMMCKAIHGLIPPYLCNDVAMIVDVHGYNTRSSENINLYVPTYTKKYANVVLHIK